MVSTFVPAEGLDRWLAFSPELICWGTGDKAKIDQCFARLGFDGFDRIEACIGKGLIPGEGELILLDADDNVLETLSIEEERKKYPPARS